MRGPYMFLFMVVLYINCILVKTNQESPVEEQLRNCVCVNHAQCTATGNLFQNSCVNKAQICCPTASVNHATLLDLLDVTSTDVLADTNSPLGDTNTEKSECICLQENVCRDELQGSFSTGIRCPDSSHICCLIDLTDDKLISGIFGVIDLTSESSITATENQNLCTCVPREKCKSTGSDLSFIVNVRSRSRSSCENHSFICCSEENILGETLPIGPTPDVISVECICVEEQQCEDNTRDLISIVHVRSSVRANVCSSVSAVCCPTSKIKNGSQVIEPEHKDSCICVFKAKCKKGSLGLTSILNVPNESCPDPSFTCCSSENIEVETIPEPVVTDCECVHISQCSESAIESVSCGGSSNVCCKKSTLIDVRSSCTCVSKARCKKDLLGLTSIPNVPNESCPDPSFICCLSENIDVETIPEPISTDCSCVHFTLCKESNILQSASCGDVTKVCCKESKLACGLSHESNFRIDVRLRGGFQAKFGEFPWMIGIFEENNDGSQTYTCGGSLIHPRVVLTTAHCIDKGTGNVLIVRAGDWNIETLSEPHPHEERYVIQKNLHPHYSSKNLQYDIGLVILDAEIPLQFHINTICLPTEGGAQYITACLASGWGKDRFGEKGVLQTTLKKINLPLIENSYCEESLRKTILGPRFNLDSTFVCAGSVRDDACTGDGGSPLVCPMGDGSNRFVQVGAVAWGIECGNPDIPGVYASVQSALPWINEIITKELGIEALKYYT